MCRFLLKHFTKEIDHAEMGRLLHGHHVAEDKYTKKRPPTLLTYARLFRSSPRKPGAVLVDRPGIVGIPATMHGGTGLLSEIWGCQDTGSGTFRRTTDEPKIGQIWGTCRPNGFGK